MRKLSNWEKLSAALLAGFLLFTGGMYLGGQNQAQPMRVTVQYPVTESPVPQEEETEEPGYPPSLLEGERINLNTAGAGDLRRLPGIGEKRAQAILAWREANGPFSSLDELLQVEGIGPGILEGLKDYAALE